eukprot:TRINITY_DN3738_c0_g1_i6.p2 TRINITY_DN3738_c0_g1~~TRINITY_DN3738_c0_g1_i6.p2  ORF type:complete len:125 (+),score=33.15 TRINITY_DN3738_c0_g1_i6:263-637(+)
MRKVKRYEAYGQPKCLRVSETSEVDGYGYFYYENDSDKKLCETVNLSECEILKLVGEPKKTKQFIAEVMPNEDKIFLLKRAFVPPGVQPKKSFGISTVFKSVEPEEQEQHRQKQAEQQLSLIHI